MYEAYDVRGGRCRPRPSWAAACPPAHRPGHPSPPRMPACLPACVPPACRPRNPSGPPSPSPCRLPHAQVVMARHVRGGGLVVHRPHAAGLCGGLRCGPTRPAWGSWGAGWAASHAPPQLGDSCPAIVELLAHGGVLLGITQPVIGNQGSVGRQLQAAGHRRAVRPTTVMCAHPYACCACSGACLRLRTRRPGRAHLRPYAYLCMRPCPGLRQACCRWAPQALRCRRSSTP